MSAVLVLLGQRDSSVIQDVLEPRSCPFAVHHSTIVPLDPLDSLELDTHGMSTVTGALKGAHNIVLREVVFKVGDGEAELFADFTVDLDTVGAGVKIWLNTVVAIIAFFDWSQEGRYEGVESRLSVERLFGELWHVTEPAFRNVQRSNAAAKTGAIPPSILDGFNLDICVLCTALYVG